LALVTGETNLDQILATITVSQRPGVYTVTTVDEIDDATGVHGVIAEDEGMAVVLTVEAAYDRGWDVEFEAAWLTIDIHSSLEAVGLTAAVARALASAGIPCNILAGYFHDHLLVPAQRAHAAIRCIEALRDGTTW
jgi:hypothetical protein